MSAKHAVLGLVIERPGYGYQLAQRLEERFGCFAFAPSCVYSALDQLTRDELVRVKSQLGRRAGSGPSRVVYEATDQGIELFQAWMLGPSPAPPLRDELHMKLALCRPRDLPRLIEMIYGQELACSARLRELHDESRREHAGRQGEWGRAMRAVSRDAEIASWQARIDWLHSARKLLEGLLDDTRRGRFPPAARRRIRNTAAATG